MTIRKLVTYPRIMHCRALHVLKSIVMPVNLQIIGNNILHSIVMAHNFNSINHPKRTIWSYFGKYFIVVTRDDKMGYSISRSNLNLAIVSAQYYTVTWLHEGHAN
jgi:hypothetical protein